MPYIGLGRRSAWSCPPMWIEETRGGLLSCEKRMTALAESANGSRDCAVPRGKHMRGQLWLRKRRRLKKSLARRSSQNGPAKSGAGSFLALLGPLMSTLARERCVTRTRRLRSNRSRSMSYWRRSAVQRSRTYKRPVCHHRVHTRSEGQHGQPSVAARNFP